MPRKFDPEKLTKFHSLLKRKPYTAAQLAAMYHCDVNSVRRMIRALEREGHDFELVDTEPTGVRGRPAKAYRAL